MRTSPVNLLTSDNAHTHFVATSQTMPRELASFVDYLKIEKGLASLSVAAYTRDITQFTDFLKKRPLTAARRQDWNSHLHAI